MRRVVSKWATEEEAAQMLYGKLSVILASVLWLDAQGAPQVGVSGPVQREWRLGWLPSGSAAPSRSIGEPEWTDDCGRDCHPENAVAKVT
jgi:hypothetical protein